MSSPKIAIIIYTSYSHVGQLAESVRAGVTEAGGQAQIYQVPDTLPKEALTAMHAPPKPDYPNITKDDLTKFDGYLFGIPTRYGNFPGPSWKAFWDTAGPPSGALVGKFAGVFVSTGTLGGGQETTVANALSTLVHHGISFVPLGYKEANADLPYSEEVHGGSAWGAGTITSVTGARRPSDIELRLAKTQGSAFYQLLSKHRFN